MKIHFLTIVLDGMPWIACHLPVFNKLSIDWHWHIVEGVADNTKCTSWCKKINPRLSIDGTTEYIDGISYHNRVSVYRKELWDGKIEMVNAPLDVIEDPGILWEVDADEMWTAQQIEMAHRMFVSNPRKRHAQFKCRYFVGPSIVVTSDNTYGNHHDYEWYRAWIWEPGKKFLRHEPPVMDGCDGEKFTLKETVNAGLVFDHYAYATEEQVAFKEYYYGYNNAVEQWRSLQENRKWPAKLGDFCKWVKDDTTVEKLWNR